MKKSKEQILLEENGYMFYLSNKIITPYSDFSYQKEFRDNKGIKYFIDFVHYPKIREGETESWMLDFRNNTPHYTFQQHRVELKNRNDLIKLEKKCELFFKSFKCEYYELYD